MGKKFPDGFLWGTAISSFQSEMGRGEPSDKTDWWEWVHDPGRARANGIADDKGDTRNRYLLTHVNKLHQTIFDDKVPLKGYFHWTLMDNFEWSDGYKIHFGLFRVDQETNKRIPTKTVEVYRKIASSNSI